MSVSVSVRKPLGVRATPDQHRLLTEAAAREQRSVSSFVLQAALERARAASGVRRTPESVQAAITEAQELMRPYRRPGVSMADAAIAESRAQAERE